MANILGHKGNATQNDIEFYLIPVRIASSITQTTNAGKDAWKRNTCTMLVGMYICATAMESSMEGPQKTKNGQALVAHTYNTSNSGGRDHEDCGSKPARANSL
jgi:hypothetical protein